MSHPYKGLPDHHFWRRSVSAVERHLVDPVVAPRFAISADDRVATAGSCFAQHISRRLSAAGFRYFVAEEGEASRNFGVFSARFGNIYTSIQLLQLFQRAHGAFVPAEEAWARADGRLVDPFRPNVEPEGFASLEDLRRDRDEHLRAVRRMFAEADVFVFTMGLTEGWKSAVDGAVFPLAPGAVAGTYDPAAHLFFNQDVDDVVGDVEAFLEGLRRVNPAVRILLTVSPVPLIATWEQRHVLAATTYSKSVLRVAAEYLIRRHPGVDYFPSYEIITGSFTAGMYYGDDARDVSAVGVGHAMRCFVANYLPGAGEPTAAGLPSTGDIACDEEALAQLRV